MKYLKSFFFLFIVLFLISFTVAAPVTYVIGGASGTYTQIWNTNQTNLASNTIAQTLNGSNITSSTVSIIDAKICQSGVYACVNTTGLVGWWKADNDWGDASGNGNNGTWYGNPTENWTSGKYNNAGLFDGVDDYVNAGNGVSLNITDELTIEAWFYPQSSLWTKKKPITITGSTSDLTDYQIKITVDYVPDMQSDFDDLRFVDANENILSYWIENYTASTNATFWVKVPSIPTAGTTIYVYYGNPLVSNESNGTATFEFFDDFNDGLIDNVKWNTSGSPEETGGELIISVYNAKEWVVSKPTLPVNCSVRFRSNIILAGIPQAGFLNCVGDCTGTGDIGHYYQIFYNGDWVVSMDDTGSETTAFIFSNSYHVFEITKTNDKGEFYLDENLNALHTTYTPDGSMPVYLWAYGWSGTTSTIYTDWIVVRKYASTEPTVTVGNETEVGISKVGVSKAGAYGIGANKTTAFGTINDQTITASISAGWNHITLTYDKNAGGTEEIKLYVDGTPEATRNYSTAININSNNFLIGDLFIGKIDEVRIYNRLLSAEEIRQAYLIGVQNTQAKFFTNATYSGFLNGTSNISLPYVAGETYTTINWQVSDNQTSVDSVLMYNVSQQMQFKPTLTVGYGEDTILFSEMASGGYYYNNYSYTPSVDLSSVRLRSPITDATFKVANSYGSLVVTSTDANVTTSGWSQWNITHNSSYLVGGIQKWYNSSITYSPPTIPMVLNLTNSTPGTKNVTIIWNTDVSSNNFVCYGTNETLVNDWSGCTNSSWANSTISISLPLSGLTDNSTYYYKPWSTNASDDSYINSSVAAQNFTTTTIIPKYVPLSIFMGIGAAVLILLGASLHLYGIPAIFTAFTGMMLSLINSQIAVNGQLKQNIGGIDGAGNVVAGTTTLEIPMLSYMFLFVGIIMLGITIYLISKELKYIKDSKMIDVEF